MNNAGGNTMPDTARQWSVCMLIGMFIAYFLGVFVGHTHTGPRQGLSAGYAAITHCDEDGVVKSVIDVRFVESDTGLPSLAEIIAHESVHRQQLVKRGCGDPTWDELLDEEIEAHCVSLPIALRQGRETAEATRRRIAMQFVRFLNRVGYTEILNRWLKGCPLYPIEVISNHE